MGLLNGKRALITGARKGIGRGIALTLAGEGAHVGVNDLVDDEVTKRTKLLIEAHGVRGSVHQGDVSNPNGIQRVIDGFVSAHGGIDILVNNAIMPDQSRPLFDIDEAYWDRMMNLSLKGYFFAAQRAARHMVEQGGGGASGAAAGATKPRPAQISLPAEDPSRLALAGSSSHFAPPLQSHTASRNLEYDLENIPYSLRI